MLVVSLADLDASSLPLAGGKAAQLGVLLRGNLPVPPGFCVTTEAFRSGMNPSLAAEIRAAYDRLGTGPVAVRSSATAEDLPEASFAGQQDTFLNVCGGDGVVQAVEACWRSLFTERAIAYRRDHAIPESDAAMAVVVQRMVPADAAGVLFTLNPVTGALDELVIEAACGLGDQVVSARVTPDRYRVRRRAPHVVIETDATSTAPLLTAERLDELANLGLAAERLLGRAADVEWAIAGGKFWLLQARAVTAAGPRLPVVHYGTRWNAEHCRGRLITWSNHNVRETMPYPHTPFSWSVWSHLTFPQAAVAIGLATPDELEDWDQVPMVMDLVDGRIYWNQNILLGSFGFMRGPVMRAGHILDAESAEISQDLYAKGEMEPLERPLSLRRLWYALFQAPGGLGAMLWRLNPEKAWKQLHDCQDEIDAFAKISPATMTESQILALARYFATQTVPHSLSVFPVCFPALPALFYLTRNLPKWGFAEALPKLLSGLQNNPTMETALAMWDVAASAGPEVRAVFAAHQVDQVPGELAKFAAGREFLERMNAFLKAHGHRAVREFDFSCPRWREDPTFVYETVKNYLAHPAGEPTPREHYQRQVREHDEARAEVERGLAGWRRWLFRKLIRMVETRLPLREAPKFYALMGLAHIRDLYLEVGRRMVARGLIEKKEDFFFFTIPEIEGLSEGRADAGWAREQVPIRRREFAQHMRANPPLMLRSDGKSLARRSATAGEAMKGTPVSWGVVRGPARILLDPGDGASLKKGDILVAPFTDPGWTPLFLTAGGLVMEIGGTMSHGAVVAREYGLPAVVSVKDATRIFRDGEILEVNGGTGEIRRCA